MIGYCREGFNLELSKHRSMLRTITIFLSAIIGISLLASCGKDDQKNWGEWSIEGFSSRSDKRGGILLSNDTIALFAASAGRNDGIAFYFNTRPTISQTFEVVDFTSVPAASLGSNQCYVLINVPTTPTTLYWSTDDPANQLQITVANGKVRADFTNLKFRTVRGTDIVEAFGSGFVQEK
jgi:hypothetical protein